MRPGFDGTRLAAVVLGVCPNIAVAAVIARAMSDDPYYFPVTRSRWEHAGTMGRPKRSS
jgi:hypothetical protein